jgi:hypothetical protein
MPDRQPLWQNSGWRATAGIGDVPGFEKLPARLRIYFKRWI